MHYIDRKSFAKAPTNILSTLHQEEQQKWLNYKASLLDKTKPTLSKPSSKWTRTSIRKPLTKLFNNNCCYCGDYSDENNDGEVDHFLPKEIDSTADHIYSWENYVWACHPCNNKKRNNYPLLDPCDATDMAQLYFHSADGRYLVFNNAHSIIKNKFLLTETFTYINGKKRPERRRNVARYLPIYLREISLRESMLEAEIANHGLQEEIDTLKEKILEAKDELKEFLKCEDFISLKLHIFDSYKKHNNFNYNYPDFI